MNAYTVKGTTIDGDIQISGETVQEAIASNFSILIRAFGIGNAAGYRIEKAWLDAERDGMADLHVMATGDDGMVEYDPIADQPLEYSIRVSGLQPGELPEQEEFRLVDGNIPFDPMGCATTEKADCLGALKAIVDRISDFHCTVRGGNPPSVAVGMRSPNLEQANTQAYIAQNMMLLARRRPKSTKEANRLLERAEELVKALSEVKQLTPEELSAATIRFYQAKGFLEAEGKVTALAKFRKAAGLSQEQLAVEVGISARQIAAYENARSSNLGRARHYVVERIAAALNVEADELVKNGSAVLV